MNSVIVKIDFFLIDYCGTKSPHRGAHLNHKCNTMCGECGKRFQNIDSYNRHQIWHAGQRKHSTTVLGMHAEKRLIYFLH